MFQWVHPLAEDAIFVHYAVTNVSKTTYGEENPIYFGMFADTHPGGMGSTDDDSYFDLDHNMVYAWDHDNIGRWLTYTDILPGYLGWKFLESPGIANDNIDNDILFRKKYIFTVKPRCFTLSETTMKARLK